ncbi:hypothetical protein [Poritiphilus flavus]|nr:hypothetical protein [Poritiphilus flavus]
MRSIRKAIVINRIGRTNQITGIQPHQQILNRLMAHLEEDTILFI